MDKRVMNTAINRNVIDMPGECSIGGERIKNMQFTRDRRKIVKLKYLNDC